MKIPQVFTLIPNKHVFNDKNVLMCFYGFGGK